MSIGNHRQRLLLLLGILSAFGLRLFHLGQESLWYDETVSVVLARKSVPALIAHTAGDIHPPGYYLLLHLWQQLVNPTLAHGLEYLFAWPSVLFGMLMVVLLYPLGRRLFAPGVAGVGLWLAAMHPYQIWYSQEVRMYTVGATLGLLCLWAAVNVFHATALVNTTAERQPPSTPPGKRRWWLLLYVIAGALGLYTLYYFLFLLIAVNLLALCYLLLPISSQEHSSNLSPSSRPRFLDWSGAQLLLLLLWSPWLPIFWRQATAPPVPPWRVPWHSVTTLLAAGSESISALVVGQSAPFAQHWVWLLIGGLLFSAALFYYTNEQRTGVTVVLLYALLPIILIYLISVLLTPLYHVRYLVLYAPPLLLFVAAIVNGLYRRNASMAALLICLLVAINGWSLYRFWFAPTFRSDDHRAAVATLAREWRPGDLILVNAGWVYTALETYWPTELRGADAAVPPPIANVVRLLDYAQPSTAESIHSAVEPTVVRSGSVNGAPTLGWGNPQSDFFAISAQATAAALEQMRTHAERIWHYRLYDTVNDEQGMIRAWLAANGTPLLDQPVAGRDFLRLQLYALAQDTPSPTVSPVQAAPLLLQEVTMLPASPHAGRTLYLQSRWLRQSTSVALPTDLRFSLRFYDAQGDSVAQQDATPLPRIHNWPTDLPTVMTLALPVPVALPPGAYTVQLLMYDGTTGAPVMALMGEQGGAMRTVGQVTLALPLQVPEIRRRLARFDYIDLVRATLQPTTINRGAALSLDLVWLPHENAYRDTYVARYSLVNNSSNVVQSWEEALGGWDYPSGTWPSTIPVRQQITLPLDSSVAPGSYALVIELFRHTDGQPIPATVHWWRTIPQLPLGSVQVQ